MKQSKKKKTTKESVMRVKPVYYRQQTREHGTVARYVESTNG